MDEQRGFYLEDLKVGMSAAYTKTVTDADLVLFAGVSGDINPMHVDQEYARKTMFQGRIAHGMLTASFISAVLGTKLPGPGCIYVSQNLKFKAPVRPGDTVRAKVTVKAIDLERGNRLELPWLGGKVVSLGKQLGVPTPAFSVMYAALKLYANGAPE